MDGVENIEINAIDYRQALAEATVYLEGASRPTSGQSLPDVLAGWAAVGEALSYPMPALEPTAAARPVGG